MNALNCILSPRCEDNFNYNNTKDSYKCDKVALTCRRHVVISINVRDCLLRVNTKLIVQTLKVSLNVLVLMVMLGMIKIAN